MLRLIGKILLAYWIAAALVYFIIFGLKQVSHRSALLSDALNSTLTLSGRLIADEYESGRCPQIQGVVETSAEALSIASPDGNFLCGAPAVSGISKLVITAASVGHRTTVNRALYELIAFPVTSSKGNNYIVVLKANYSSVLEAWGLLPGYLAISTSFAVSCVLAILVALPIRKLRTAAREIAAGKLETRVHWGALLEWVFGKHGLDDISRLVCDFNDMAERLESLTGAQRVLLRDLSHELRSPLTRLGIALSLARRERVEHPVRVHLDRIATEAKRLNELIGQILSLSYLESIHEIQPPPADVSLSELLRTLLPVIEYEAEQRGCLITTNIEFSCLVKGDEELLRSAVENILRNAIRHVPRTGLIHVEIALAELDGRLQSVIRISDNGPGIPEEELASVLEPFYRGKSCNRWDGGGFGIGLAIAHRAVSAHGGSINLNNRLEGGLKVEMRFPLAVEEGIA